MRRHGGDQVLDEDPVERVAGRVTPPELAMMRRRDKQQHRAQQEYRGSDSVGHAGSHAAAATTATPANTSHETQSPAAYTIGSSFI